MVESPAVLSASTGSLSEQRRPEDLLQTRADRSNRTREGRWQLLPGCLPVHLITCSLPTSPAGLERFTHFQLRLTLPAYMSLGN